MGGAEKLVAKRCAGMESSSKDSARMNPQGKMDGINLSGATTRFAQEIRRTNRGQSGVR
jgi:hypothetical protein